MIGFSNPFNAMDNFVAGVLYILAGYAALLWLAIGISNWWNNRK
jgi:hypothetical protein